MRALLSGLLTLLLPQFAAAADFATLEGHGGPVKAVDIQGNHALTASFDNSVGYWDLDSNTPRWLEGHRAAVNTVHFIDRDRAASGGDDYAIHIWSLDTGRSERLEGHKGKVMALASHGNLLASASWDGTIGLWDMQTGTQIASLDDHKGSVNDVLFSDAGDTLYSASADGTILSWDMTSKNPTVLVKHGFGINRILLHDTGGWLAYGALDGGTRVLDLATGDLLADLTLDRRPILAMARSPEGDQIAVGDGEGFLMIVDTADWSIARDFRAAVRGPVWALDYESTGQRIFAGGIDDVAFAWPLDGTSPDRKIGEVERSFLRDPETMSNGERQFARKCSICHTLTPGDARRAGPSLAGLFGRPAGTLPGYRYSDALENTDIIWTDQTIDKLFDLGPDHYTPGSKMPMQRIVKPQDRQDLIAYLREATREPDK